MAGGEEAAGAIGPRLLIERAVGIGRSEAVVLAPISGVLAARAPVGAAIGQMRVWMRKECAGHGRSEALVESDERFYHLSNRDRWGRRFAASTSCRRSS